MIPRSRPCAHACHIPGCVPDPFCGTFSVVPMMGAGAQQGGDDPGSLPPGSLVWWEKGRMHNSRTEASSFCGINGCCTPGLSLEQRIASRLKSVEQKEWWEWEGVKPPR